MNLSPTSSHRLATLALSALLGGSALAFAAQNPPTPVPAPTPIPSPVPRPQEGGGDQKPPVPNQAARLEVDTLDHDFGAAIEGEKLSHTFKMRSAGAEPLVIQSAKPTCGCTVAKLEVRKEDGTLEVYKFGDPLPKGAQIELLAELNTQGKHQQASSKVNVTCNDPRQVVTLGLNARVDTYFQITPPQLDLGTMSTADTVEKVFTVAGKKPGNFLLSMEQRPLPDGMKVAMTPKEPDANGKAQVWEVKVTLGPGAKEGNTGYPIQLKSDEAIAGHSAGDGHGHTAPTTYGATVMVTARVNGLISFEPQYLSFGLVRPGQVLPRTLKITAFDPNFSFADVLDIRLVGPSDTKPEFPQAAYFSHAVKVADDKKSATIELTLNGLPETVDGSFQGRMMIKTGHPQKPEVPVLFSGVCRPGVTGTPPAPQPLPQPVGGGVKGQ
ncbi:MAG: DUF1573 domain-containing protein [Planctomycetes bacterium]|nr:DUF1573 domain-containing protein [Planctomycetota bacterium]